MSARPLRRHCSHDRRLARWLATLVRSGQAADALVVLCAELGNLSVSLRKDERESVARREEQLVL